MQPSWCIDGCWFTLALHPGHEIPEWDFLDGALVGAGSLKPVELTFVQIIKKSLLEPTVVQITSKVLPNGGTTGQITSIHSSTMMPFFISY
jgi:hypothetical protein